MECEVKIVNKIKELIYYKLILPVKLFYKIYIFYPIRNIIKLRSIIFNYREYDYYYILFSLKILIEIFRKYYSHKGKELGFVNYDSNIKDIDRTLFLLNSIMNENYFEAASNEYPNDISKALHLSIRRFECDVNELFDILKKKLFYWSV